MTGLIPRLAFYPSLVYNLVMNKYASREWYHRIDDSVILGALPFRSMTDELKTLNVKGVVSLNEDYELRYLVNSNQEWKEAGIEQIHIKTPDMIGTPSQEQIARGVDFITSIHSETGGCTYVHCKAGRTRSCTLVACYLIKSRGWTPERAYEEIQSKRSHVWLREKQWDSVRSFHESIRSSG